jgi:AraC-like DNA-binding protein
MHYVPAPPLSEFVALFWYFRGDEVSNAKELVLPTATVDLIIRLDSARTSDSRIFGPRTRSVVIQTPSERELIGVHFKPGGAIPFLRFPVTDLQNLDIDVSDVWGKENAERLLCMLHETSGPRSKFKILEQWLLQLAGDRRQSHPVVTFAMRAFCSGPYGSTAEIAERTGYSQRHFIEIFRNQVGMPPKRFHRLYRFRKVIEAVQKQTVVDWPDVGLSLGYFDQAHLIHDFREFSGLTPAVYLGLRTPFINHVRLPA